jgi:hypothetical protein
MGKTLGVFASGEATALLLSALITIGVVTVLSGKLLDSVTSQTTLPVSSVPKQLS